VLSDSNARLAAARRLTSRKGRRESGQFLVEGVQAVREALAVTEALAVRGAVAVRDELAADGADGPVQALFATTDAAERNAELLAGREFSLISDRAARALAETVTPQGIVAVCRELDVALDVALAGSPRLIAVLHECNEPGNAGAVMRAADAAGADAVVFVGGVDIYNGKTVRASAGSLFHLPVVLCPDLGEVVAAARRVGVRPLAAALSGRRAIDDPDFEATLEEPTLWLFGSEAHGLPEEALALADEAVRIPIYGRAESLNLAAAAAVCLYASARSQHRPSRHVARASE